MIRLTSTWSISFTCTRSPTAQAARSRCPRRNLWWKNQISQIEQVFGKKTFCRDPCRLIGNRSGSSRSRLASGARASRIFLPWSWTCCPRSWACCLRSWTCCPRSWTCCLKRRREGRQRRLEAFSNPLNSEVELGMMKEKDLRMIWRKWK